MVIFHSYVSLPEGNVTGDWWYCNTLQSSCLCRDASGSGRTFYGRSAMVWGWKNGWEVSRSHHWNRFDLTWLDLYLYIYIFRWEVSVWHTMAEGSKPAIYRNIVREVNGPTQRWKRRQTPSNGKQKPMKIYGQSFLRIRRVWISDKWLWVKTHPGLHHNIYVDGKWM